jgi:hypothetical protein
MCTCVLCVAGAAAVRPRRRGGCRELSPLPQQQGQARAGARAVSLGWQGAGCAGGNQGRHRGIGPVSGERGEGERVEREQYQLAGRWLYVAAPRQ